MNFVLGTLTIKERRSLALRSKSPIHLLELTKRLRPNTINFSRPHLVKMVTRARTATLPTIVEEVETYAEQV